MPAVQLTFDAATPVPEAAGSEPLLLTVREAARLLAVSRTTLYELMGRGDLEAVHIGRAVRVPREAVVDLVRRLRAVPAAS